MPAPKLNSRLAEEWARSQRRPRLFFCVVRRAANPGYQLRAPHRAALAGSRQRPSNVQEGFERDERGNTGRWARCKGGAPRTLTAAYHSLIPAPRHQEQSAPARNADRRFPLTDPRSKRLTPGRGARRPARPRTPTAAPNSMMRNSTRKKRRAWGAAASHQDQGSCYPVGGFGHNHVTYCIRKLKTWHCRCYYF